MALTSLGIRWLLSSRDQSYRLLHRPRMPGYRDKPRYDTSIIPQRLRRGKIGALRLAAQPFLQVRLAVAVEEVADQPAVEVGGAEQPVGDRERQVHVGLHHQPRVVVGSVMTPQRVHEWAGAHEP